MKTTLILFMTATILMANSCDKKDDCKGEPPEIIFNEPIRLEIVDRDNRSVFSKKYDIDSLKIIENNHELDFELDPIDSVLSFYSEINSVSHIESNWGLQLESTYLFQYSHQTIDTLTLLLKPILKEEECNARYYDNVKFEYNSVVIRESNSGLIGLTHLTPLKIEIN